MSDAVSTTSAVVGSVAVRRLHPATIFVAFVGAIRSLIFPLAFVMFSARNREDNSLLWIGLAAAGIATITGLWRYFSVRYFVHHDAFELRTGLIFRQTRRIPLENIHDVQTKQGILQRVLGVVEVNVETAGGKGSEATLAVVSLREYTRLRDELTGDDVSVDEAREGEATGDGLAATGEVGADVVGAGGRGSDGTGGIGTGGGERGSGGGEVPPPLPGVRAGTRAGVRAGVLRYSAPAVVLHEVPLQRLILAGLTSNRIGPFMAAAFAAFSVFDDMVPDEAIYRFIKQTFVTVSEAGQAQHLSVVGWVLLGLVLAVFAVGLAAVGSAVGAVIQFYGFKLTDAGSSGRVSGVVRSFGLFTTQSSLLPRGKVQAIEIRQGLLRQLMGLASVHAVSAASDPTEEERKKVSDVVTPICKVGEALEIARLVTPSIGEAQPAYTRVSRSYVRRAFQKQTLVLLGVVAVVAGVNRAWWPVFGLGLVPLVWLSAYLGWKYFGYVVEHGKVWIRQGVLSRQVTVADGSNAHAVSVSESPFDRRHRVRHVRAYLAASSAFGSSLEVPSVKDDVAAGLAMQLAGLAAESRWETTARPGLT